MSLGNNRGWAKGSLFEADPTTADTIRQRFERDTVIEGDSTAKFAVRNASGQNLIEADTTNGKFVVRQPGGTAGTDEVQIYNNGTTHIFSANSGIIFEATSGEKIAFTNTHLSPNSGVPKSLGRSSSPWSGLFSNGSLDVALASDTQGLSLEANSTQTSDLVNITSNGGTAGDLFTIDGSGNVRVGTTSSQGTLEVNGGLVWSRVASGAGDISAANATGVTILAVTDASTTRTVTLPSADVTEGHWKIIKDESGGAGGNNITVATEGSETIDGSSTATIGSNHDSIQVYSDGTNWFIV